jgi:predicted alpha/beta-fold hydrolase
MSAVATAAAAGTGFDPWWLLAHPHLQSMFATKSPRRWRRWRLAGSRMSAVAQRHVLDCGEGVRLTGYHCRHAAAPRGLVVLIHGWEGSHESLYLYSMACHLYAQGWNVFRLNLRDHGGTHALNREPFHSGRIAEVFGALRRIREFDEVRPWSAVGFSLGGNFALRIGLQGPAEGLAPDLAIGISPSINPGATLRAIDDGPRLFRLYYMDKWRKSLRAKQQAWPGEFDFSAYRHERTFVDITRRFVADFTEYGSAEDYLAAYTLTPDLLMRSPAPLAIITAQDDPVIPFGDFAGLREEASVVAFDAPARGGHCGFIENLAMECWTERRVEQLLAKL